MVFYSLLPNQNEVALFVFNLCYLTKKVTTPSSRSKAKSIPSSLFFDLCPPKVETLHLSDQTSN